MEVGEVTSLLGKVTAVLECPLEEIDRQELEGTRDELLNGAIPDVDSVGFLLAVYDALDIA